ncbi:hypothetical protein L9F63_011564 [Diploptera punctata]|uniref:Lipase domain-containing protein n=1 Tax=Diploptera punctata TaxID=6984 RepID=A0AAD8AGV7_DIPPU|nr:hypothetical protein L9F63_011564 [Diploptera punctata]
MEKTLVILSLCVQLHTNIYVEGFLQKCCKDLGCFNLGDPWSSIFRPIPPPQCPDECPAVFRFFSRTTNSENYTVSGWPITSFNSSYFDRNRMTVIAIHGWFSSFDDRFEKLKNLYLEREDTNFIFIDWSICANQNYFQTISTMRTVAAQAVRFVKYLSNNYGMSECKLHIIGLSLGSHVGAYIAKGLSDTKTKTPCVERLTGLEPAAPLFQGYSDEVQISRTDAKFVEIAHTSTLPFIGPGVREPRGHVDYYFNGNILQPGCLITAGIESLQSLKEGNFSALVYLVQYVSCSHGRALSYYTDSLRKQCCIFWGERIDRTVQLFNQLTLGLLAENTTNLDRCNLTSCSPFGIKAMDYPARGSFFVATLRAEPYCSPKLEIDNMMAEMLQEYKQGLLNISTTTTDPSIFNRIIHNFI